jgi:two-component system, chemotaxis family, CheB/CheR fusion protein
MNETAQRDTAFEALLQYLKTNRGFDFTGYKRTTLVRRVQKRMATLPNITTFADYQDYLEVHPEEFTPLFNTILINVTAFFRDAPAWEYVGQEIIPRIIAGKGAKDPIRVCCIGCASGEEAYTIAMLLAEALGEKALRERVKIYATDVDGEALTQARHAVYSAKAVDPIPEPLRSKYFEQSPGGQYTVKNELRRVVIFGRHDLVQDAPISRLDLLICRNTLMYFNSETQSRILARFHFALSDNGILFLGKSEMLITHTALFTTIDLKHRLFGKAPKVNLRDRLMILAQAGDAEAGSYLGRQLRIREIAFDAVPAAQFIIDLNGRLVLASAQARALFQIAPTDVGRPLQDLEVSYRPVELRSLIQQAYADKAPVTVHDVKRATPDGSFQSYDVVVTPLQDNGNRALGVAVSFSDVSRSQSMQETLQHANADLETANEELQSTNEELETTNEELQSTNEELETTNEELQSTNEELETMNEELQATNEELETTNDELQLRTEQATQSNAFLTAVLGGLRLGIAVLNHRLEVVAWNATAEDLWGLRADEVRGQSIFNLDFGLPIDRLKPAIRACLAGEKSAREAVVDAVTRRGKPMKCRVNWHDFQSGPAPSDRGLVLMMEETS